MAETTMQPQLCPQCGQPRANPLWRLCSCGHDFGEALPPVLAGPPANDYSLRYHTFWPRFGAGLLDGLLFIPVDILTNFLFTQNPGPVGQILLGAFSFENNWIYSVLLHARFGQTIGKMASGVRVLDVSESRLPTFRQALLRDIGPVVLNTISLGAFTYRVLSGRNGDTEWIAKGLGWAGLLWFMLEVVTMLLNPKRRAFHDLIAGTVVVNVSPPPLPRAGVAASGTSKPVE
jgi:uncharacterized RDD family membrane protein YckC